MLIRYFLSGASGIRPSVLPEVAALVDYRLLSMHKAFKGNTKVWCEVIRNPKSAVKEVMLDSGAFTAFTKGHKVALDDLIATYRDTERLLRMPGSSVKHIWFINLDVIPGKWEIKDKTGKVLQEREIATDKTIQAALDESDLNYERLCKEFGRERVLPVYHQTEDGNRLADIVRMSGGFIACGFRQDVSEEFRIRHAEETIRKARTHTFRRVERAGVADDAAPRVRADTSSVHRGVLQIHGLATTGYKMLARAHFDTVDSATWLYIAAMGGISYLAENGELVGISISNESPGQRDLRGHYKTLTPLEQAWIEARVKDSGATMEQVQSDLSYRILFNAHQMREWLRAFKREAPPVEVGLFPL